MRVLKESCKRWLQISKVWRQNSHHQEGLAAIQHNPHSDWFITPALSKYHLLSTLERTKSTASQVLGKVKGPPRGSKRNLHQKTPHERHRPLPRLLYIQNPIVWVSNKLDFRYLRVNWDPLFTEADFTRGARQAVSRVTQMVSGNKFESMKPLLTKNALLNLRRDVEVTWGDEVKRNIGLAPEDVQLIIPRKLHFRQNTEQKLLERGYSATATAIVASNKSKSDKRYCDIDVLFIALKHLSGSRINQNPLCFVDIIARFHRNYSENIPPEWTISAFKVRRFNVIPQKQD